MRVLRLSTVDKILLVLLQNMLGRCVPPLEGALSVVWGTIRYLRCAHINCIFEQSETDGAQLPIASCPVKDIAPGYGMYMLDLSFLFFLSLQSEANRIEANGLWPQAAKCHPSMGGR